MLKLSVTQLKQEFISIILMDQAINQSAKMDFSLIHFKQLYIFSDIWQQEVAMLHLLFAFF